MPVPAAEDSFRRGLVALTDERYARALECFESAIDIERQSKVRFPDPRYLSYYGVSLARAGGADAECIRACEVAARQDPFNPAILANLGRVYVMAGRYDRALESLDRALHYVPGHPLLTREVARTDRRSTPVLSGLDRSHSLNRWLGRLRARTVAWAARTFSAPRRGEAF